VGARRVNSYLPAVPIETAPDRHVLFVCGSARVFARTEILVLDVMWTWASPAGSRQAPRSIKCLPGFSLVTHSNSRGRMVAGSSKKAARLLAASRVDTPCLRECAVSTPESMPCLYDSAKTGTKRMPIPYGVIVGKSFSRNSSLLPMTAPDSSRWCSTAEPVHASNDRIVPRTRRMRKTAFTGSINHFGHKKRGLTSP